MGRRNGLIQVALGLAGALLVACGEVPDNRDESSDTVAFALCQSASVPWFAHIEAYNNVWSALGIGTQFVLTKARSVAMGYSMTEGEMCTGVLISQDLILSAGHCHSDGFHLGLAPGDTFRFNHQAHFSDPEDPPVSYGPSDEYTITSVVDWIWDWSNGLDVAVFRVSGNPGANHPVAPLRAVEPDVGEWLTVIGQPGGSIGSTIMSDGSTVHRLKRVSQGPVIPDWFYGDVPQFPEMIHVRADVVSGFSGGPIFNGTGEIVAITAIEQCSQTWRTSNHGSAISKALARWQTLGLTELTNLVLPAVASPCLAAALPTAQQLVAGSSSQFVSAASPNDPRNGGQRYGYPGCPYCWVVEVTNVLNKSITPQSRIVNPSTSSAGCQGTMHTTLIKGFKNNQWSTLLETRRPPEWDFDDDICVDTVDSTTLAANHGYSKVRIVTRVESGPPHSQEGPAMRQVRAGVLVN